MTLRKLFFASLFLASSLAEAGRTTLADLGLSVNVPTGWTLSYLTSSASDTENTRMYAMINQAKPDRAVFTFEAIDGVGSVGAHAWTVVTGYAESLFIQGYPFSVVYLDDSVTQDGLFAWRVYGRYGDYDAQNLPTDVVDRYSRIFANGNMGWIISFEGDTADIDTAGPTYTRILDSVKVDRTFQALPVLPGAGHRVGVPSHVAGGVLEIPGEARPVVQGMDGLGRVVTGELVRTRYGWSWTPRSRRPGLVFLRVQAAGRDESLRAVFQP